jgi:hypothetical protein
MDNKKLLHQYITTGAILTAHQIKFLKGSELNSYFKRRFSQNALNPYYGQYKIQPHEVEYLNDKHIPAAVSAYKGKFDSIIDTGLPSGFEGKVYALLIDEKTFKYGIDVTKLAEKKSFFTPEYLDSIGPKVADLGGFVYGSEIWECPPEYLPVLYKHKLYKRVHLISLVGRLVDKKYMSAQEAIPILKKENDTSLWYEIANKKLTSPELIEGLIKNDCLDSPHYSSDLVRQLKKSIPEIMDKFYAYLFNKGGFTARALSTFPEEYHLPGLKKIFNDTEHFFFYNEYTELFSKETVTEFVNYIYKFDDFFVDSKTVVYLNKENLIDYLQKNELFISSKVLKALPKRKLNYFYSAKAEKGNLTDEEFKDAPLTIKRKQLDALIEKFGGLTPDEKEYASKEQLKKLANL